MAYYCITSLTALLKTNKQKAEINTLIYHELFVYFAEGCKILFTNSPDITKSIKSINAPSPLSNSLSELISIKCFQIDNIE